MRNKNSSEHPRKVNFGGIELKVCMTKVRNFVEITPNLPFSEVNFYELYRETLEKSEMGKGLRQVGERMMPKRGRKDCFKSSKESAWMEGEMNAKSGRWSLGQAQEWYKSERGKIKRQSPG